MDVKNIYRTFYPTAAKYIFFSCLHRTFSRTDHILGHKTSLNKLKKTKIILGIFSYNSGIKLEEMDKFLKTHNLPRLP